MIVLSEDSDRLPPSASRQENHRVTEAAKLLGAKVYYIPDDFSLCQTAENALWHIPKQAIVSIQNSKLSIQKIAEF